MKLFSLRFVFIFTILFVGRFVEVLEAAEELKYGAWGVSFALTEKRLSGTPDHSEFGQGLLVGISWATLRPFWYFAGQAETQLGPYASLNKDNTKTDFFGTSFEVSAGYKLFGTGFRSEPGSLGIGLILKYSDEVGRSVGSPWVDSEGRYVDAYEMNIRGVYLAPSLFYAKMRTARLSGNTLADLLTRIEGFRAEFACELPVRASYDARYRTNNRELAGDGPLTKVSGVLGGYSLVLKIVTYLGI